MPTFSQLAGAKTPRGLDGISFAPTLLGESKQREHDYLYWEFKAYGGQQALRMGDWKGVRQGMLKRNGDAIASGMDLQLYNLASDPGESMNVANDNPKIVKKMKRLMRGAHEPSELFPFDGLD